MFVLCIALSGQDIDVNARNVTFAPKIKPPFKLPVMIPTVWGSIQSEIIGTDLQYTLSLEYGELEFVTLTAGGCPYQGNEKAVGVGNPVQWNCPY